MGYTHYFEASRPFTDTEWTNITGAVIQLLKKSDKVVFGPLGTGMPVISKDKISFNGDANQGLEHESFTLPKNGRGFQFCKTAAKPYDDYVVAVLIICHNFAPDALDISSDGELADWQRGHNLAYEKTKIDTFTFPPGIRGVSEMAEKEVPKKDTTYYTVLKEIENIAKRHFRVVTLEERKSDRLDFYDTSVLAMKRALLEAYELGVTIGVNVAKEIK